MIMDCMKFQEMFGSGPVTGTMSIITPNVKKTILLITQLALTKHTIQTIPI